MQVRKFAVSQVRSFRRVVIIVALGVQIVLSSPGWNGGDATEMVMDVMMSLLSPYIQM